MAHLYESMLREVRDAAGDSGEFYTPRPAIRFVVQQVAPQLGETILDPACGTGGFLVEALEELEPTVENVEQLRALHGSLRGIEKKPLPYLLGMMNLLLHGVEQPALQRDNALAWRVPIAEIEKDDAWNLDQRNPNRADDLAHRPPDELVAELIETEKEILALLEEIQREIATT